MHANAREEIDVAYAGDIVALPGLAVTSTGDTLCDPAAPVVLQSIAFPEPVIEIAVEAKTAADQEKMESALARLAQEDPTFQVSRDPESGQTVIRGMGELHLEIIVDRMKREFKVNANIGTPQVAYRETITRRAEIDYVHDKQLGGSNHFARIKLDFAPGNAGSGFAFESKVASRPGSVRIRVGCRERVEPGQGIWRSSPASRWSISMSLWSTAPIARPGRRCSISKPPPAPPSRKACARPVRFCSSRSCGSKF